MQNVTIFPITGDDGSPLFRAVALSRQSEGRTVGEALDAIAGSLPVDSSGTMVVIQPFRPDAYFSADQIARLEALMAQWREAREHGTFFSAEQQQELQTLVETELRAATDRAASMLQGLQG